MIDIHCHVLPGIDDGPSGLDGSLDPLGVGEQLGVVRVVGLRDRLLERPRGAREPVRASDPDVNEEILQQQQMQEQSRRAAAVTESLEEWKEAALAELRFGFQRPPLPLPGVPGSA